MFISFRYVQIYQCFIWNRFYEKLNTKSVSIRILLHTNNSTSRRRAPNHLVTDVLKPDYAESFRDFLDAEVW